MHLRFTPSAALSAALVAAPVMVLIASPAAIAFERLPRSGKITVCGTFGNAACYTAPVRMTTSGPQFRLTSGRWVDCAGDCRDTLRRETVDFWDELRNSSRD
jgi:hypothetical protein